MDSKCVLRSLFMECKEIRFSVANWLKLNSEYPRRMGSPYQKKSYFWTNFFYSLLRPKKYQKRNTFFLLNKISSARALKFHSSNIFKGL
jgi:hypothetical protein